MRSQWQDTRARLRASELLGKAQGDFLEGARDNEAAEPPSVVRIVIEDASIL